MIERQTLTFGVRFARGPHEAALDALGAFYGFAERALHARKRACVRFDSLPAGEYCPGTFQPDEKEDV